MRDDATTHAVDNPLTDNALKSRTVPSFECHRHWQQRWPLLCVDTVTLTDTSDQGKVIVGCDDVGCYPLLEPLPPRSLPAMKFAVQAIVVTRGP